MSGTSPSTLGQAFRTSVPDQGYPETVDLFNLVRGHTGLLLTLSTTPLLVLTSDVLSFKWAASSSVAAYVKTLLPPTLAYQASKRGNATTNPNTYNVPLPRFRVHGRFLMSGATDTPVITLTAQLRAAGGAIKATFTPTSPGGSVNATTKILVADGTTLTDGTCAALANPTNPDLRTWDFYETYGTGPVYAAPGDYLDLKFVPGAHTTDDLQCHGLTLSMNVNPNYTVESARS